MTSAQHGRFGDALVLCASLIFFAAPAAVAQSDGTPSAAAKPAATRAPYLTRGDQVEQRYKAHREKLEKFFGVLTAQFQREAPALGPRLLPPTPVPFGYQIVPNLLADPTPTSQRSRIVLSPFSWVRTDSIIDSGSKRLTALQQRFDSATQLTGDARQKEYGSIADEYRRLVDGQKFMESLIQYNRLWQSEIARLPELYRRNNALRDAALARQSLLDSLSRGDEQFRRSAQARAAAFSRPIDSALKKAPTAGFIRVIHPTQHLWIVIVPVYTDIVDSAFVNRASEAIERGWHVRDVDDDFSVKLEIRRVPPSQLYAKEAVPPNGQHINVTAHIARFPKDRVVLTTGANSTYVLGQSILLGPHAIPPRTLVHEFGHMLGFKDGYFRSFYDLGENGFNVVELILDPDDVVAAPEHGKATRQHFEQILRERR